MRETKRKLFPILCFIVVGVAGAAVVAVLIARSNRNGSRKSSTAAAVQAVPVETEFARKGDIGDYVSALGTVTPVYTATVLSRIQGQVLRVDYVEGQTVKTGDLLLEIDPKPYVATLMQAQGTLDHDRGALKEASIDLIRYRKAWEKRAIQKQLLDDQEQIVIQEQGAVKADEGALAAAQANLSYCYIRSPINGRVGLRLLDPGNMVQANSTTPLVVVAQFQPITVIFSVAEDFLPEIEQELSRGETMPVEAYDRGMQTHLATGTFLSLDNQIDTTTGTIKIRASFDNHDNALFPNQFVNVKLLVRTEHDVTLVSTQAVQRGAQGSFIYVLSSGNTPVTKMQPVKPGTTDRNLTAVKGVKPGEQVVVSGFEKLGDGSHVTIENEHQLAGKKP